MAKQDRRTESQSPESADGGGPMQPPVPFSYPPLAGPELQYIGHALESRHTRGDGPFTDRCHRWLEDRTGTATALLTHSCTAALEMTAILADVGPGDEVIMPSYTFASTANAFVLRGAVPVFVDIRHDTLNLDERRVEDALTGRTKAIVAVHYAGVGCEMDALLEIASRRGVVLIEDAAQAFGARYRNRPLGSIGDLGTLSFHESKNVISGEGGALLINRPAYADRAEIIREKGTDRRKFLRGEVDKYTWVDVGSSYLPSDIVAAFLLSQLEISDEVTGDRVRTWFRYHERFADLEVEGLVRRPVVPPECTHNGHLYYLLVRDANERARVLRELVAAGVTALFHYVPLHSAPAGLRFGRTAGSMAVTDDASSRLVRLPLWPGMPEADVDRIDRAVRQSLRVSRPG